MHAGIDGCRYGWLAARVDQAEVIFELARSIRYISSVFENDMTLIDIPIGLSDHSERACDIEARRILKPKRHSSVFLTPVRAAAYAESYEEACRINFVATGKKISKQAWNILPKVREIDAFKSEFPGVALREAHPEICFWALNGKTACSHNKKTPAGISERLNILERTLPGISHKITAYADANLKKHVSLDDIIDAAVLALTAARPEILLALGNGEKDQAGIPMEIVYSE
ncbi:MAG: DUF429 domain-containing protein [Spirochaetales bacterium]|nr:DUF429 domain-containing protein [Spirochaetales bacterium]MCF7949418.1 DUF429 domain-containing protein [Spirochaetia bacterium]MCF7951600.1 DUF429 domain-containing protein [Spirochaetaceae bacterium]